MTLGWFLIGWPTEVTKRVWQPCATWDGEDFLKFLLESGEAETPPTVWMPLMPLTQVFFVFRSQKANNIWKDINKLVDEIVKKYTKYGWYFPLLGWVHSSLDLVVIEVPLVRGTEPGDGSVVKQKGHITLVLSSLSTFLGSCLWVKPHCKGHSSVLETSQIKKEANQ